MPFANGNGEREGRVDGAYGLELRVGETLGRSGGPPQRSDAGVELAALDVADHAVGETVELVAGAAARRAPAPRLVAAGRCPPGVA